MLFQEMVNTQYSNIGRFPFRSLEMTHLNGGWNSSLISFGKGLYDQIKNKELAFTAEKIRIAKKMQLAGITTFFRYGIIMKMN